MELDWYEIIFAKMISYHQLLYYLKVNFDIIQVGSDVIQARPCARKLGSWFNSTLSMSSQVRY